MYIGKAVDTAIHDHHTIQIAISFEEAIEIRLPDTSVKSKAVIIDSDQPHRCLTFNNVFLLLNIAPETNIGIALKKNYLLNQGLAEIPFKISSEFTDELRKQLSGKPTQIDIFSTTRQFLYELADIEEVKIFDPRILEVLRILDHQNDEPVKIGDLAGRVFMSPGRLIHLFTEQVGIPIRKYILWTKLLNGVQNILVLKNITKAALEAGFSDAPHFNRTFRRMFGLSPSALLKNSQFIQAFGK